MKVLILGGGITGLSAAWYLSRRNPQAQITLLEKENRLGGWIRTTRENGFLFEKGPRTFPLGRSPHLLSLIQDLNLPIITSPPQTRYLLHKGKLRSLGSFIPGLIPSLIRSLFTSRTLPHDESIYDYASRRYGPKVAETLFDPLTLGIYAGDIRKLSMQRCFPSLYYKSKTKNKTKGLFTIPSGMETLITALQKTLPIEIHLNCPIESIQENQVLASGTLWQADHILNALPPQLPTKSLWAVNLAYSTPVLPKKGYGYLVPTHAKETLLGVVFDSSIFPTQNSPNETRLTALLRAEETHPLQTALNALRRHLSITARPTHTSAYLAQNAIPQFEVGCTYPFGISVEACLERGKTLAEAIPIK